MIQSSSVPVRAVTPDAAGTLAKHLATRGRFALERLGPTPLLEAWCDTVAALRDSNSDEGSHLRANLRITSPLSPEGLEAALHVVLRGVDRLSAAPLIDAATARLANRLHSDRRGLVAIIAASNVPGLAAQPLLPALALGRPTLIKSPTTEPTFAASFVRGLVRRAPDLADAVVAVTWQGGDKAVEESIKPHTETLLAYGDGNTIRDLRSRWHDRLIPFGPKISIAIIGRESIQDDIVIDGLAEDIALLDQRGCLSVQAVYTDGDAEALARRLASVLDSLANRWPVGRIDPAAAIAVQRLRTAAAMTGHFVADLDPDRGTIVVEPDPTLRPSPGLRSVRIHPVDDLTILSKMLKPSRDHLQGASLADESAWRLADDLRALGLSRLAVPGTLQHVDTSWHNDGRALLDWLG